MNLTGQPDRAGQEQAEGGGMMPGAGAYPHPLVEPQSPHRGDTLLKRARLLILPIKTAVRII